MTERSEGEWRWPLPDDWEPSGYWCVCITIPADQQYFDRLTGALGALTLSKSWYPDPTGQGPVAVAYAWESALYVNPFQLSDTCYVIPSPPIPDEAAANDAAAAVFTVFLQHIVAELNSCAPTAGDCAGCVDTIMAELEPYGANDAVRGALARLCADLNANPDTRASYEDDCVYADQFNDLRHKIADNPYDWLNQLSGWMFDWLNQTADAIFQDLNTLAGLLGTGAQGYVNDHGGIPSGGGAGFGSTCSWSHIFNVTALAAWHTVEWDGDLMGDYNSSLGWACSSGGESVYGYWLTGMKIQIDAPAPFNLTGVSVTMDLTYTSHCGPCFVGAEYHDSGGYHGLGAFAISEGVGVSGGWSGDVTADAPVLDVLIGVDTHDYSNDGQGRVFQIVVTGTGTDPWA